jgi:hypothetical protein
MKEEKVFKYQNLVLKALAGQVDDFYLAGGTALSLFYFQHRLSVDLDFFTPDFSLKRIKALVEFLTAKLSKQITMVGQSLEEKKAKFAIYNIYFSQKDLLKIDFVEDFFELIKQPKVVDGIKILSLEDIYLRKIHAAAGLVSSLDVIGRKKILGGRIEAKDFCDLYFLSNTFISLAKFVDKYTDNNAKEGLINWFRTYDRMAMIEGILDLDIEKKVSYKDMEKHFSKEIGKIAESYIE